MISKKHITDSISQYKRKEISHSEFPDFTKAAVLIPLIQNAHGLSVLLTVRTKDVETHKGQISFPGGVCDESDADAVHTALRELEEELGLVNNKVEVLGILDDFIVPTRYLITPVVGYLDELPVCSPNPLEVEEVFDVTLSFFLDKKNGRTEQRKINGVSHTVWFFQYGKHLIWGATAGIIMNMVDILQTNSAKDW
jgi:8-oxo-dGTP pyrophosphatase MutT (NUDIX family)